MDTIAWFALESVYSVSADSEGSIYLAGYTKDLDGQINSGGILIKYNDDGSKVWQLLGSSSTDFGMSVSTASDGSVYIAGNFDGENNVSGLILI